MGSPWECALSRGAIRRCRANTPCDGHTRGEPMTTYLALKLIHVLAAIVAVGTNVTYFVWLSRTRRQPDQGAYVLPGIKALDARLANPAYVVLPVTGILM